MFQRLPVQKLHRYGPLSIALVNFVNRADVRMVQRRCGASFAAESFESRGIFRDVAGKKLQRDEAAEIHVLGFVDHTHPAAAQFLDDAIVRDGLSNHSMNSPSAREFYAAHTAKSTQAALARSPVGQAFLPVPLASSGHCVHSKRQPDGDSRFSLKCPRGFTIMPHFAAFVMTTSSGNADLRPSATSAAVRQIGFLPLLAIFYGYTAGGPFGYEVIFQRSGPGMALVFLTFVPLFWSIPVSFASAELNSVLPVQGGFYRWTRAAFGDFWGFQCGWWNWTGTFLLNASYGV